MPDNRPGVLISTVLTVGGQGRPELQGLTKTLLHAKGEMLYHAKRPISMVDLDLTLSNFRHYEFLPVVVK